MWSTPAPALAFLPICPHSSVPSWARMWVRISKPWVPGHWASWQPQISCSCGWHFLASIKFHSKTNVPIVGLLWVQLVTFSERGAKG